MLLQFNFQNFKSFRDKTSLDLTATKITEHSDRVIKIGNEKILSAAVIFGANASGKSNIIEAFRFMKSYVVNSFAYGGESSENPALKKLTPFLFDEVSAFSDSEFEVYFIDSEKDGAKTYKYGFKINENIISEEWLISFAKTSRGNGVKIFYRNTKTGELDLSGIPQKMRENIKVSLEDETLIVSLGAKLKIEKLKHIRDWFINLNFADYGEPFENLVLSRRIPKGFDNDETVRQDVVKYLSTFDNSIIDFKIEKIISDGDENKERFKIETIHRIIESDKTISIPLRDESAGTLKMFSLYPAFQNALKSGSVLFIDELNARLHPLLVRNFLITFLNPEININHAQIIFTSHDSWQLGNNLLRRDEIWFTEKNNEGISELYSLADFVDDSGAKIRKDEDFESNYLLGKYGAIPSLKSLDIFEEGSHECREQN